LKFTDHQHSIAKPYIPHTAVGQAPAIIYLKVKTGERDIEYIATLREPNASNPATAVPSPLLHINSGVSNSFHQLLKQPVCQLKLLQKVPKSTKHPSRSSISFR